MSPRHKYPSEIDTARRCWRRWAFSRLGPKEEFVQSPSQILGDELHDKLERWNKLGHPPVEGASVADDLALVALPHVAMPKTGRTEGDARFSLPDVNGAPLLYGKRTDWSGLSSDLQKFAEMDLFGVVPVVLDLKTSSQPLRYGMWTRDQFLEDTAAILYLSALAQEHNADCVGARWLYLKTPKKNEDGSYKLGAKVEALPSDIVLGRDALGRAHLKVVAPFARGIDELREQATCGGMVQPLALPFNMDACNDFNRPCDYLSRCAGHFDAKQMVSAGYSGLRGETNMGMMQQATVQNGQMPAPAAGGYQPPAPMQAPVQNFAPQQQQQAPVQNFAPQQQAPAPAFTNPAAPPGTYAGYQPPAPGFTGVNPPEAQAAYGQAPQQQAPQFAPAPVQNFAPQQQQQAPVQNFAPQQQAPAPMTALVSGPEAVEALRVLIRFLQQ